MFEGSNSECKGDNAAALCIQEPSCTPLCHFNIRNHTTIYVFSMCLDCGCWDLSTRSCWYSQKRNASDEGVLTTGVIASMRAYTIPNSRNVQSFAVQRIVLKVTNSTVFTNDPKESVAPVKPLLRPVSNVLARAP